MKKILSIICTAIVFFGCSTNSNNGTVTVVPLAPTSLTGTVISTTQVNLSWTDNATNEDGYKIERKTSGGNFTVIGSTSANISNFSDFGLTGNTAYTYRVYAYNSAGSSLQYSNEITVTTQDSIPAWLNNGLVGYWPFNGNANDESGNGNDGTVNGATLTEDRFGNSGKAYNFDGISNCISTADIDLYDNYTISVWAYPIGIYGALVDKNGENSSHSGYVLIYNNSTYGLYGHVGWSGITNNNIYPSNNRPLSLNQWQNCILSVNNGIASLYVNGLLTYSQTGVNSTSLNNDILLFGKSVWGGNPFNGSLDEIRIYNRALSASEVSYLASH